MKIFFYRWNSLAEYDAVEGMQKMHILRFGKRMSEKCEQCVYNCCWM